jgi:cyclic pyranopterin phosphate synthase
MVDVGSKAVTRRVAVASCLVFLPPETLAALGVASTTENADDAAATGAGGSGDRRCRTHPEVSALASKKGPILTTAVIAGVMAAKRTHDLIPFCHPLPLDGVDVGVAWEDDAHLRVTCAARVTHKTGEPGDLSPSSVASWVR